MDDSIPAEEVSLNNIPVHISSRRRPESPAEISSSEEETNKQIVLNANNCQLYTEIVNVNEEDFCSNSGGFLMNSYNQNNSVLRELSISTGKSDSEFTEEDEDVKPLQSSREDEKYQNNGDISQQNLFFNQDNLIKKGIIKIIMGADTETDSSSCYDISCSSSSNGFGFCSSIDSNCYNNNNNSNNNTNNNSNNNTNNNSDKENMSPFPENINSQTCASSTPSAYQHNVEPINSKSRQVEVEILDYNLQSPKKEILSQSSSIYGESLDTSSSIFSKTSSSIPSFSINDTSIEIENTNTSSLMIPNSFEVTGIFSGHDSHHLNSSNRESHSFASERPAGNLTSEELEEEGKNGEISQTQNNDFSSNCCVSFDQDNSNNDASVRFNDSNNKDIETSVFSKNCTNVLTEDSLNSKKCAEDTFSSFPSSSSSHEEISFTSILENDSRYQDEMMPSQRNASRLLGYCPEYEKESPQTILNRMQGVDLFIKQQPFLKSYDIRSSHKTSTPLYQRQKLAESQFLETSSNQHDCSQKTFQHSNQIIHTPHPKRGQLIYCHGLIDNSTEFQPQTPMNGPLLNSSGEENSSPEYLQFMNSPFSRPDDVCHKSDMCHEDDPIRHQHKLNERKRRARITIACDLMRRLVPGISDKTDQATVFEYAARYIHFLQTQVGNKYNRNFLVKYSPYKLMEIEKFLP